MTQRSKVNPGKSEDLHRVSTQDCANELAAKILNETRVSLMMTFRFLDRALWKFQFDSADLTRPLATDGHKLYYDPMQVITSFRSSPTEFGRVFLHSVLHCILRQPYKTVRKDTNLWSLSCDLCIEIISHEMSSMRMPSSHDNQIGVLSEHLSARFGSVTPSKLYRYLLKLALQETLTEDDLMLRAEIEECREIVQRDSHSRWNLEEIKDESTDENTSDNDNESDNNEESSGSQTTNSSEESDVSQNSKTDEDAGSSDNGQNDSSPSNGRSNEANEDPEHEQEESRRCSQETGFNDANGSMNESSKEKQNKAESTSNQISQAADDASFHEIESSPARYEEADLEEMDNVLNNVDSSNPSDEVDWEDIAQQIETELRTFNQEYGAGAGNLVSNLALANRSRIDYESFLKRFATMREDMKTNDEEFDYIFYTHGLNLYGNMPLIEPLEYKEDKRVREFVIALDTSGSCSHGLTRVFLTRTYEILTSMSTPGDQVNVHIIQCDSKIQLDTVIKNTDELKEYTKGFEIRGNGGTDFRPVFSYVNELVATGQFENLRGVIYFTDGFGKFPSTKPEYEVAFVFVEEEGDTRRVPPWAMKVIMDEDHIQELDENNILNVL